MCYDEMNDLTLVHFCVDFDKVFAMCHKHYTP